MKRNRRPWIRTLLRRHQGSTLYIQAPLPSFLHTLPILLTIEGQGSGRQGPSPLTPPEEPAND